jgi:hypothetical protein
MKLGLLTTLDKEWSIITDVETKEQFYVYHTEIPVACAFKNYPVNYELYTNLYMSQVDKIQFINKQSQLPEDCRAYTWGVAWNNLCIKLGVEEHKQILA